jgi:hypothetical protein
VSGRLLFKGWVVAAAAYVLLATFHALGPIEAALARSQRQAAAPPAQAGLPEGGSADEPAGAAPILGRTVLQYGAIIFAPPLLVLWFGWDVWFAVTGFLERRPQDRPNGDVDP